MATRSGPFPFRILLVDDDVGLAGLYAELLSTRGYDVHVARGGFEALADLRHSLPDLVVSDLGMPGMSGLELLAILRQRFPSLPLIALSGGSEMESGALVADVALQRSNQNCEYIFESIAHLLRTGVHRRTAPAPLPWLPRAGNDQRLTCGECLRSYRVPCVGAAGTPGVHSCVCVYCGTPQHYIVGEGEEAA